MSDGGTDVDRLVTSMTPTLHDVPCVFVTLPHGDHLPAGVEVIAAVREPEGLSVVTSAADAETHGLGAAFPCARITLQVHSALEAVGFLAVVAAALAGAGISANAVAGFHHDHLFVPWPRRLDALEVLRALAAR